MSVLAASRVAGRVPTTFVSSLHSQAWDLAASGLGFPPILIPASDWLTNCKVGKILLSLRLCQLFRCCYHPSLLCPQHCSRVLPPSCHFLYQMHPFYRSHLWCPAEAGEPDRFGQICGIGDPQLFFNGWLVLMSMSKNQNGVWIILVVGWRPFQCIVLC